MYTKLDVSLTLPMPRGSARAAGAATGLDALPDELIGDIARPVDEPLRVRAFRRGPWATVLGLGGGGLLLMGLLGLLWAALALAG